METNIITPVGLNASSLNVDRIRVPRRNNAVDSVSFGGGKVNPEKASKNVKKGVKGLVDKFVNIAKGGLDKIKNSNLIKKIGEKIRSAMTAVTTKTGEVFDKVKTKFKPEAKAKVKA